MFGLVHTAELTFECGTPRAAQSVLAALRPETDDGPEGSAVELSAAGATLTAKVAAKDVATLRAALNSVARLCDAALRTVRQTF